MTTSGCDAMTERKASKYRVTEHPDGFTVQGPDRVPVTVTTAGTVLQVQPLGSPVTNSVAWPHLHRLVQAVAGGLMQDWQPPAHPRDTERQARGQEPWVTVTDWARGQTARALAGRIRDQWVRLQALAPPEVLAVQWAVWRVAGRFPALDCVAMWPELYGGRYPWLVSDATQYRAAAITVGWAHDPHPNDNRAEVLDHLAADWQAIYSHTGHRYTSLSRTLMQLPGRVPPMALGGLAHVALPRPITERGPLLVALMLGKVTAERWPARGQPMLGWQPRVVPPDDVARPFLHCTVAQVQRVLALAGPTLLGRPGRLARAKDVLDVTRGLLDYPDTHRGGIVGLARKAVRWHLTEAQAEAERQAARLGHDRPTATLPVPLPADASGITYLATVGDVVTEGAVMQHCGGTLATGAARGDYWLFHVDWQGDQATVQVGHDGTIMQARGPRNTDNTAAAYGARVLRPWGRQAAQQPWPVGDAYPRPTTAPAHLVPDEIPF